LDTIAESVIMKGPPGGPFQKEDRHGPTSLPANLDSSDEEWRMDQPCPSSATDNSTRPIRL
jgi:hypothetical protein